VWPESRDWVIGMNIPYVVNFAVQIVFNTLGSVFSLGGFTEEDLLKIWKGLHYCVWMSDKPLVQVW